MAAEDRVHVETAIDEGTDEPAVLLLHSLAMDHTVWDEHVRAIGGRVPVVRCDLPGHGRSDRLDSTTIEEMGERVASVLDELPWDRYVVGGLSLGGCVAQAMAIERPDLVLALLLIDTTSWYGPDAVASWDERAAKVERGGMQILADLQLARWFSPAFRDARPDVGRRVLDIFAANDPRSYAATCRAMGRFDARERLSTIEAPTRVLVGELDASTPVAHAELLAESIPDASMRILYGASHMSAVEQPDPVLHELLELHARAGSHSTPS